MHFTTSHGKLTSLGEIYNLQPRFLSQLATPHLRLDFTTKLSRPLTPFHQPYSYSIMGTSQERPEAHHFLHHLGVYIRPFPYVIIHHHPRSCPPANLTHTLFPPFIFHNFDLPHLTSQLFHASLRPSSLSLSYHHTHNALISVSYLQFRPHTPVHSPLTLSRSHTLHLPSHSISLTHIFLWSLIRSISPQASHFTLTVTTAASPSSLQNY